MQLSKGLNIKQIAVYALGCLNAVFVSVALYLTNSYDSSLIQTGPLPPIHLGKNEKNVPFLEEHFRVCYGQLE